MSLIQLFLDKKSTFNAIGLVKSALAKLRMTVLEENAIDKSGRNVYVGGRWECIWKKLFIRENMPLRIM